MKLKAHSHILLISSVFILIFSAITFLLSLVSFHKKEAAMLTSSQPCKDSNCTIDFFLKEQGILEQRLQSEDAAEVYADILSTYKNSAPRNQHGIAHIFGEVLYKSRGLSGITVCDGSFAFGCFHGLMVNALPKEGLGSVQQLDQMCNQKFGEYNLGCQHGLGHGIAEFYGSSRLNEALDTCATLSWKHQLMGCAGGVFMEHVMPTLGGDTPGSVKISPVNEADPYTPCNKTKAFFKAECYYNIGSYYYYATSKDTSSAFNLCQAIAEPFHKKTCLLGLGNAVYSNLRDIPQTIHNCSLTTDKESEISCRSGAAWLLYANPTTRNEAKKFCEDLTGLYKNNCLKDTNLIQLSLKY